MKFNFYKTNLNLNNKSILVTGGTGSFGQAFVKKVLSLYKPKRREHHKLFITKKKRTSKIIYS